MIKRKYGAENFSNEENYTLREMFHKCPKLPTQIINIVLELCGESDVFYIAKNIVDLYGVDDRIAEKKIIMGTLDSRISVVIFARKDYDFYTLKIDIKGKYKKINNIIHEQEYLPLSIDKVKGHRNSLIKPGICDCLRRLADPDCIDCHLARTAKRIKI